MPSPARIVGGLPCLRCGYSLQGLTVADRCPECGEAAAVTARDHLVLRPPWELARLRRAAKLVMLAGLMPILVYALLFVILMSIWFGRKWVPMRALNDVIIVAAFATATICPWIGFAGWRALGRWMSLDQSAGPSSGQPGLVGNRRLSGRAAARLLPLAAVFAVGATVAVGAVIAGVTIRTIRGDWPPIPLALLGAVWCVRNVAGLSVIGDLAGRTSMRRLAASARLGRTLNVIVAVGACAVGLVVYPAVVMASPTVRSGDLEIIAVAVMYVVGLGFVAAVVLNIALANALRVTIGRVARLREFHQGEFIRESTGPTVADVASARWPTNGT